MWHDYKTPKFKVLFQFHYIFTPKKVFCGQIEALSILTSVTYQIQICIFIDDITLPKLQYDGDIMISTSKLYLKYL